MSPEPPLRVLLVPSAYYPHVGGIEELTRRLALGLEARGHETAVLTNRWPGRLPTVEQLDGVRVQRVAMPLPAASARALGRFAVCGPASALVVLRAVHAFRPDVVHVHGAGPNAVYLGGLQTLLGARLVLGVHGEFGGDAHGAFAVSHTLRAALGRLLRTADAVTAPSRFVLDELAAAFALRARTEVIPNGVDAHPHAAAEDGLGRYALAVGRLVPQKGFDTLIDAYARVRDALGLRLVIAGDGPERDALRARADAHGLNGEVTLLGSVPHERVARLLRGAAVAVAPSRYEAFGLALLEALAAGTPLVAARVGGIPEAAGDAALLVPPDDPQALGAALVRVATDAPLRARLSAAGRVRAQELDWPLVVCRYEALYRELVRA